MLGQADKENESLFLGFALCVYLRHEGDKLTNSQVLQTEATWRREAAGKARGSRKPNGLRSVLRNLRLVEARFLNTEEQLKV